MLLFGCFTVVKSLNFKVPKIRQFCSTHIIQVDIKIYSTFLNTGSDEHTIKCGSIDEVVYNIIY